MHRTISGKAKTFSLVAAAALVVVGCGNAEDTGATDDTGDNGASNGEELNIAFFGFSTANSFAQATFAGIEEYAEENDATATFYDGGFDASTQAQQIQDATTSGDYDVFIVQANDGAALINPVEAAVAADITVVAEFTPLGTEYDTADPQVDGVYSVVDVPADNGAVLGEMGAMACEEIGGVDDCQVAYLQGDPSLPLDNTRNEAVYDALDEHGVTDVIDTFQGGYSQDEGRAVGQDLLQSYPDVDVIIGSSQAIFGVENVLDEDSEVQLVGNGGSRQAVTAVQEGRWFATYFIPESAAGALSAEIGLGAARGEDVPESINTGIDMDGSHQIGTAEALEGVEADYDD